MFWEIAVFHARRAEDVSYDEWCALYYDPKNPTQEQILKATEAAKPILVRNGVIEPGVVLELTGDRDNGH